MKLTKGLVEVDLGRASGRSNVVKKMQISERSGNGTLHTASWNVETNEISFKFSDMQSSILDDLISFFYDTVNAMSEEFSITDDENNTFNARFSSNEIKSEWSGNKSRVGIAYSDCYNVTFYVEKLG